MNSRRSNEERVAVVRLLSECNGSLAEVQRRFKKIFPRQSISKATIKSINNKFDETGSVHDMKRSGRPLTGRKEEMVNCIQEKIKKSPRNSIRRLSREMGVSRSTVHRIVRIDLKLKCYTPTLVQELQPDDLTKRMAFAEKWLERVIVERAFLKRVIWSDEAIFKMNGIVNRHNCTYWCKENPGITVSQALNAPGIMVWAGLMWDRIIGPFFFDDGKITSARYLQMLQEEMWPSIENHPALPRLVFQQDGAPPHYGVIVRQFLDERFPQRWIGRQGPFSWPPRSPDLTPLDFWLWGYVKDEVYKEKPKSLVDLKERIIVAIASIQKNMCQFACMSVTRRMERLIDKNGAQIGRF
jgi:transposase